VQAVTAYKYRDVKIKAHIHIPKHTQCMYSIHGHMYSVMQAYFMLKGFLKAFEA